MTRRPLTTRSTPPGSPGATCWCWRGSSRQWWWSRCWAALPPALPVGAYDRLDLPAFAPPSWLFGPVWTVLYLMIAVAGWLYWRQVRRLDGALLLYGAQLVLNAAWTPLFFGADAYGLALVDIVVLAALVLATALAFARAQPDGGLAAPPYLLWVLYAAALNASIWSMN